MLLASAAATELEAFTILVKNRDFNNLMKTFTIFSNNIFKVNREYRNSIKMTNISIRKCVLNINVYFFYCGTWVQQ
jgi:hypothetical protein